MYTVNINIELVHETSTAQENPNKNLWVNFTTVDLPAPVGPVENILNCCSPPLVCIVLQQDPSFFVSNHPNIDQGTHSIVVLYFHDHVLNTTGSYNKPIHK